MTKKLTLLVLLGALAAACAVEDAPAQSERSREYQSKRRDAVVRAVEEVGPAVVNISTQVVVENPYSRRPQSMMEWFFGGMQRPRKSLIENSLGSGVIVDPKGYVLTNDHVISAADRIVVTLQDERQVEAELVGSDPASDLAVIRLKGEGPWPSVPMGSSSELMIGETLIAIGNPLGFQNTVTVGVASATGRTLASSPDDPDVSFSDFIQTDAAINPGNSGGALLNIDGELVGINTQIAARAQNLGFAIPVDRARRTLEELVLYGRVRPVWTGLVVESLDQRMARSRGMDKAEGVFVVRKFVDSPADGSKVRAGDIVVEVEGVRIKSIADWATALANAEKGSEIQLKILRGDELVTTELGVAGFPENRAPKMAWELLGIRVEDARQGVAITQVRPGSWFAERASETPRGLYVVRIDGKPVESADDFYSAIADTIHRRSTNLVLATRRGYFRVSIPTRS